VEGEEEYLKEKKIKISLPETICVLSDKGSFWTPPNLLQIIIISSELVVVLITINKLTTEWKIKTLK